MKKIIMLPLMVLVLTGCEKYLDKNPQEGGLSKFTNADQYDGLLNNIRVTRNRFEWSNAIQASDDYDIAPEWQQFVGITNLTRVQAWEAFSTWNQEQYRSQPNSGAGAVPFQSTYSNMYDFNYIIGTIDDPTISGSPQLKKKVKAEAKFWRGFYHFLLAVEFCQHPNLNSGQTPGIGYRDSYSTVSTGVEERKTVKYTFERIVADLEEAEAALNEVGATRLLTNEPWRISAPAVQAQLARTYLYLGDYSKAFAKAKLAYSAYSFLYDMNNTTLFSMVNLTPAQTEVYNGVTYSVFPQYPAIAADGSTTSSASNSQYYYKEAFFRCVSQFGAMIKMPPSQGLYNTYEAADLRKQKYFDNNLNINTTAYLPPRFKDQLISKSYGKNPANVQQMGFILGVTVPEIMLIMAECRARNAGDGEAANVILKTLRRNRFPASYIDNIGSSLNEVKDERRRELAMLFRWYDLKRYNALDNDNITITKLGHNDPLDPNSPIVTYKLAPNAPTYALPIIQTEIDLLGWQQNEYGGVTKQ
jgi:hypothetical protein